MIRLILLVVTAIGTLFFSSRCFVDSWIVPKWIFFTLGISLYIFIVTINYLFPFDKSTRFSQSIWENSIVLAVFFQALYGIMQYADILPVTTRFPMTGSFDNPAGYTACLSVGFPFILYRTRRYNGYLQYMFISIAIIVIMAIILSGSRAGIISILIVLAFWSRKRIYALTRIKYLVLMIILIISAGGLYYAKKDSADGRLLIWKCSLSMIKDKWFIGHGSGGFQAHYMDYQAQYFRNHPKSSYKQLADTVQSPFCEYLSVGINYGVTGLLIIGYIIYLVIKICGRNSCVKKEHALSCCLSIATFAFFSYPLMYPFVWIVLLYSFYILMEENLRCFSLYMSKSILKITVLTVLILSIYAGLQSFNRILSERKWKKVVQLSLLDINKDDVLDGYERVYLHLKTDRYFLYNYSVVLYKIGLYDKSLSVALQCRKLWADYDLEVLLGKLYELSGSFDNAEECYRQSSFMCPNRFIALYYLVLLLDKENRISEAKLLAKELVDKPVKVQSCVIHQVRRKMKNYLIEIR